MAARENPPRMIIRDEALMIIAKTARAGRVMSPSREARCILQSHPDCGVSEDEIRQELLELAVERRLAVDPAG